MTSPGGPDPIEAMEQFLARIAPFDDGTNAPVMTVDLRLGRLHGSFELSERAARALTEALTRYTDPDDCGRCSNCSGHLDTNLRCRTCGHVDGIFGSTIAHHAANVARRPD